MEITDILQMMEKATSGQSEKDLLETDLNVMRDAMNRRPLEGLVPGDLIVQVKHGRHYQSKCDDRPVIFSRYLSPEERIAYNKSPEGNKMHGYDAEMVYGVDLRDGEVIRFLIDTTHFQRYVTPGEKILAEIEAEEAMA